MSTTEVCDLLNMRPQMLRNWRIAEYGPKFEYIGDSGRVRYYRDSVMAFIESDAKGLNSIRDRWANRKKGRMIKKPPKCSDYVRRASSMPTPFKYDIGLDSYTTEYDYEDRASCYNAASRNC